MESSPVGEGFLFGTSALGTGAVTLALSAPSECVPTGYSEGLYSSFTCTNILGFETIVLNQGQAWLLAGLVGAAVGGLVTSYHHLRVRRAASPGPSIG